MYKAGYAEGRLHDPHRLNWHGDGLRPLVWSAWYPAAGSAIEVEKFIGPPDCPVFRMGQVAPAAELSDAVEKWPVVLLSHGTGGAAQGLGWLGRRLASRGFISLAVSHHGNTAIEPYLPEGFLCWWERASDLTTVLDLLDKESIVANRLDMASVFASGFSLGGHTALSLAGAITSLSNFQDWLASQGGGGSGPIEFPDLVSHIPELLIRSEQFRVSQKRHSGTYRDARLKAATVFAPAPPVRSFLPGSIANIAIPVSIMVGQSDTEAPHDECAVWLVNQNPAFNLTLLGHDVGHYVFLCESTEFGKNAEPGLCVDSPGVDRNAIHDRIAELTEALFRSSMTSISSS